MSIKEKTKRNKKKTHWIYLSGFAVFEGFYFFGARENAFFDVSVFDDFCFVGGLGPGLPNVLEQPA